MSFVYALVYAFGWFTVVCWLVLISCVVRAFFRARGVVEGTKLAAVDYEIEQRAFRKLCMEIAAGLRPGERLWWYHPTRYEYEIALDADDLHEKAVYWKSLHVVRWDGESKNFERENVTAEMPVAEIAE